MANWVTTIKTSPDVNLPLEPHPATNPASWLGMSPGPPPLPKQRPALSPMSEFWTYEPHPSLSEAVWEGMAQPPTLIIQKNRPASDVFFVFTPPIVSTYDYGWASTARPPLAKPFKYEEALHGSASFPVAVSVEQWLSDYQAQPATKPRAVPTAPPYTHVVPVVVTPTYDYGWAQQPSTAARPKPNAPPQADPYVAAAPVTATYDYGWNASYAVPKTQRPFLWQQPAEMFVRANLQPPQDYTCPPRPAALPPRRMGQLVVPDTHVRLIVIPTYDYGWPATYRVPKIPRVEGRQPIDMHYTPFVEISLLDEGKIFIGTPFVAGLGGTTSSIGEF